MTVSKVITIEVGDYGTKLCEMDYNKKHPTIYRSAEFINPAQSVEDGFITDQVSYRDTLGEELKKAGIRCRNVIFTLASNKVLNREVTIPEMKEKLIVEYLESERESFFPMDISNHELTYHIIETKKEEKQLRLMVYAAPSSLIKSYIALASGMDFKLLAIDYNGNSIYQWLISNRQRKLDLYLQINERNAMFTILENGVLALQRNMNFGTDSLLQNMMNPAYDDGMDEVAAALALSQNDNFFASFAEMNETQPQNEKTQREYETKRRMTELLRPLVGNISRVLEYYNMKNREANLKTIYIGGSGAGIKGLKELLENEFDGLEFELLLNLPGLNVSKNNSLCNSKSSEFIACIGAGKLSINFKKEDEKEKLKNSFILSLAGLGVVAISSVIIVLNGVSEYHSAVKERNSLSSKIAELADIETLEREYLNASGTLEEITAMDSSAYHYNEEWNDILGYLETELPSDTVISSLSSSDSGLTMNITVNTKEEAAKLLLQLKKIPYFTSVAINGLVETNDQETGIKTVTFSVACAYQEEKDTTQTPSSDASMDTQTGTEGEVTP